MSSYRKRPVVIEAFRFDPAACGRELPGGIQGIPAPGADNWDYEGARFWIHTLEGDMIVSPGDWIITGVKGERYPCKPDIFELTYEPTDTPAPQSPAAEGWIPTREEFIATLNRFPALRLPDWDESRGAGHAGRSDP